MKKIIAFILALTMIFVLCACGDNTDAKSPDEQNTDTAEKQDESSNSVDEGDVIPVDENDGQGLSDEEMLAGVWLNVDHVNYDKMIDFMYLTSDGYALRYSFDLTTKDFFHLANYITLIGDSTSSDCLVEYYSAEGIAFTIDEVFSSEYYDVNKYEIKNDEMIITYPNGEKETIGLNYNPIVSMTEIVITESAGDSRYIRHDNHMEDSYRYFVGNWNYEQTEWSEDKYGIVDTKEFHDSGSLFFGENFRVNESNGNTGGWGYNDGILEIDGSHYDVIILSHNKFILYDEYDSGSSIHYEFSVFDRA